ncbi:phosphohydrolase [Paenibacillus swuensis]|uniref:Phosphohydrolase n=1 Tax=Paenibacillus swuensis TaxID=1178515 RepID=A0A172TKT3_9BACL|nr:HD domain-containing protein [Paenibacillus swuensis]ANE47640.1 phosphohydrolase [Paenibacillus swuensis]
MAEKNQHILSNAREWVIAKLGEDSSGHDAWHTFRVANTALRIALEEGADSYICELAALLHDMADEKLVPDVAEAEAEMIRWMHNEGVDSDAVDHVMEIIRTMSFKGGNRPAVRTLEGRVVQDADRLDAIGAIGIARVFAYTGWKGSPLHDPNLTPRDEMTPEEYRNGKDTAINHFYEKLLRLKALMNTNYGLQLAGERHAFMEQYLEQFYEEWEGKR